MSCNFRILSAVENYKLASTLAEIGFEAYACSSDLLDVIKKCCTLYPDFLIVDKELFHLMRKTGTIILFETRSVKIIVIPDVGDVDLKRLTYSMLLSLDTSIRKCKTDKDEDER